MRCGWLERKPEPSGQEQQRGVASVSGMIASTATSSHSGSRSTSAPIQAASCAAQATTSQLLPPTLAERRVKKEPENKPQTYATVVREELEAMNVFESSSDDSKNEKQSP